MIRPPACMEGVRGGDQTVEWPEPCPRVEQGTKKNTASQCLVLRTQHLVATYCSPGTHSCFTEPGGEVVPLFSIHLRSKVESGGCGCLGFYPSASTAPRSWSTEFSVDTHLPGRKTEAAERDRSEQLTNPSLCRFQVWEVSSGSARLQPPAPPPQPPSAPPLSHLPTITDN